MVQLSTHDLYEAAYYLLNQCELEAVEATELDNKISCKMIITGSKVGELQTLYFHSKAEVNLFEFRRMYSHLNKVLFDAKKEYKRQEAKS